MEAWPEASSGTMDHDGSNGGSCPHGAAAYDTGRGMDKGDGTNQATDGTELSKVEASARRALYDAGRSLLYDPAHRQVRERGFTGCQACSPRFLVDCSDVLLLLLLQILLYISSLGFILALCK